MKKSTFLFIAFLVLSSFMFCEAQISVWTYAKASHQKYKLHADTPTFKNFSGIAKAIVLPFKWREGGYWEPSFSLGSAAGIRYQAKEGDNESAVCLYGYFGLSNFTIDNTNSASTTSNTRLGPTLAGILTFQPKNLDGLEIGVTLGWDFNSKNNIDHWNYDGKPWLSFGISKAVFTKNSEVEAKAKALEKSKLHL